jgi:hypothetical protein
VGYKYGNLALQVEGVSDETVKYDYGFYATRTIKFALQTAEMAPHRDKTATFRQKPSDRK